MSNINATEAIKVFEAVSAQPQTVQWVINALAPAIAALKVAPPPVHFTSIGQWAGVSDGSTFNPQWRIAFSNRVRMYAHSQLISLWFHELCHRLNQDIKTEDADMGHGAGFFCLQAWCFMRLQKCGVLSESRVSDWLSRASLYDLADRPLTGAGWDDKEVSEWVPDVMRWALEQAHELVQDDTLTAEKAAVEIGKRYSEWQEFLLNKPERKASEKAASIAKDAAEKRVLSELIERKKTLKFNNLLLLLVGSAGYLLIFFVMLKLW